MGSISAVGLRFIHFWATRGMCGSRLRSRIARLCSVIDFSNVEILRAPSPLKQQLLVSTKLIVPATTREIIDLIHRLQNHGCLLRQ